MLVELLNLLVFRRSEFFGVPVKCAEAGWLLQVNFHGILLFAVALDTDIAISGARNV